MNTPTPQPKSQPRWMYAIQAVVLGLVVTACAGMLLFLGTRHARRIDMTATRQHELSPRSKAVLQSLDRDMQLVIAYDGQQIGGTRLARTLDVLEKFQRGSPRFSFQLINTASQTGLSQFDQLLGNLAEQDKPEIQRHVLAIEAAIAASGEIATRMDVIADAIGPLRDAMAERAGPAAEKIRQIWDAQSAEVRAVARNLREASSRVVKLAGSAEGSVAVPPLDKAEGEFKKPMLDAAASLARLGETLDSIIQDAARTEDERQKARAVAAAVPSLRDKAVRAEGDLGSLGPVRMLLIARAIQRTQAALLIDTQAAAEPAGRGLTAIDMTGLFPDAAAGMDLRFRAEELVAGAITSLGKAPKPLVVLVHSAATKVGPQFAGFRVLLDQLQLRAIDMVEWAVATEKDPPAAVIEAEKSRSRPVVYVSLPDEVRARPESAVAMGKLANVLRDLINSGRSVLLSYNPSTLAANGSPDPLTDFLPSIGLSADTARPLLEEGRTTDGRTVTPDQIVIDPHAAHPISGAISGVKTLLPWPIPLAVRQAAGAKVTPLIVLGSNPQIWAEADWQPMRATMGRSAPGPLPSKDSARDGSQPDGGWLVAAAVERPSPGGSNGAEQRVVVVGSNYWFVDVFAQKDSLVDGKVVRATPGNTELFLASVAWLAHQDDQIASAVSAAAVPVIRPLTDQQRSWLNWSLLAIAPGMILLAGVAWRLWRG